MPRARAAAGSSSDGGVPSRAATDAAAKVHVSRHGSVDITRAEYGTSSGGGGGGGADEEEEAY